MFLKQTIKRIKYFFFLLIYKENWNIKKEEKEKFVNNAKRYVITLRALINSIEYDLEQEGLDEKCRSVFIINRLIHAAGKAIEEI